MTSCVTAFEKLYWYSFMIFKKIIEKHFIYKVIIYVKHRLDFLDSLRSLNNFEIIYLNQIETR